jgi:hypothetical protein
MRVKVGGETAVQATTGAGTTGRYRCLSQDNVQIAGVVVTDATREGCPLTYVSPGSEQLTATPPLTCWAASAAPCKDRD